ncbi:hypothetical protein DF3PB_210019 [uncultured Defluviicoccus sp.]|uniref:Uncharacterized protein n=1 Tax=metagenome TaxID=256318 RepID=A0A380TBG0_9ZZZZ|nr:hypothetical protein DF3PB_210019 [uncultured Defluviicoccus sp.]
MTSGVPKILPAKRCAVGPPLDHVSTPILNHWDGSNIGREGAIPAAFWAQPSQPDHRLVWASVHAFIRLLVCSLQSILVFLQLAIGPDHTYRAHAATGASIRVRCLAASRSGHDFQAFRKRAGDAIYNDSLAQTYQKKRAPEVPSPLIAGKRRQDATASAVRTPCRA